MIPPLFYGRWHVCRNSRLLLGMMDELKRPPLVEQGEEMMLRLMLSLLSLMERGECFLMELRVSQMCGFAWTAARDALTCK